MDAALFAELFEKLDADRLQFIRTDLAMSFTLADLAETERELYCTEVPSYESHTLKRDSERSPTLLQTRGTDRA